MLGLWKEKVSTGCKIKLDGFLKKIITLWLPVTGGFPTGMQSFIWSSGGKKTLKE